MLVGRQDKYCLAFLHIVGCFAGPVALKHRLSHTDRILPPCAAASSIFLHCRCCLLRFCLHWPRHGKRLFPYKKRWVNPLSVQKPRLHCTNAPLPQCAPIWVCGALLICILKSRKYPNQLCPLRARMPSAASFLLLLPHPGHSEVQTGFYDRRRRCIALEAGRVALTRSFGDRSSGSSFIGAALCGKKSWNFFSIPISGSLLRC